MKKKLSLLLKNLSIKSFLILVLAGAVNAFGITLFLAPVSLLDSGISGTSMLLDSLTPEYLTLSVFLIILNVPLFLYGLKKQGATFTVYAIFSVLMYSLFAIIYTSIPCFKSFLEATIPSSPFAGTDLLLCALFGGVISGIGSGIAIRGGGAMDGIEVMAVIFAKRLGMTVGTFVMMYNIILYIICGIITESWQLPLYSIISYTANLKTIDFIVEGLDRAKSAMIITSKPNEVCAELSEVFGSGITTIEARGYYSQSNKTVVYIVLNRFQIGRMKAVVNKNDPFAYISISDVADVYSAKNK